MSALTRFRIALFEFLAFPAHLWLRLCAFLIGARWVVTREFSVEHDDPPDDDPPYYGGKPPGAT